MGKKINKVGIIGCGAILRRHIESIELNNNFKLQAVCDIDTLVGSNAASKYKIQGYQHYQKMIQESDINFVVIATPNSVHVEQSLYALEKTC